MNHKMFEDWLFADHDFNDQDAVSPQPESHQDHLRECEVCGDLAASWYEVEAQLRDAPMLSPQEGFTSRFQAYLEADRKRFHRRQSFAVMSFSILAAILVFGSLLILIWPWLSSPNVFMWTWIYRMFTFLNYAEATSDFLATLLRTVPPVIPPSWWMIFMGILSELGVLWVVSYRLLTNPRRITQ